MAAFPAAPSTPPETPDETIARLTAELHEALDQQAATTEILQVINSSPGHLAPVFDAILEKAHALCGATRGALVTYDDEWFRAVATRGMPERFAEHMRRGFPSIPGRPTEQLSRGEHVHILDLPAAAADSPPELARLQLQAVELAGTRTILIVPLCKDGRLLGYIAGYRTEVRPFTDKQIALLQNFAAQAVIAMENARLLTETREALEQQTATAEVLQVINFSPGDLTPVFDAILQKAHSLCGADFGSLLTYDGEFFRRLAAHGPPGSTRYAETRYAELMGEGVRPGVDDPFARLVRGERLVHDFDLAEAAATATHDRLPFVEALVEIGIRTQLVVPLRRDDRLLGAITANRQEVRPFTDKQIALLQNFAAQAVIAMENARLLTETREALEQQTATAEVLQVINSSPGDLAPVFDAILEKARTLCEAAYGVLWTYNGVAFRPTALHDVPRPYADIISQGPFSSPPGRGNGLGQIAAGADFAHFADVAADEAFQDTAGSRAVVEIGGARTMLVVALRKDATLLGAITAYRKEVRPFTDTQITLLQNFAAQAVIAMENARLLTETREALEQQTATAEVLQVINSSPGDRTPVFEAILEKARILCGAAHGSLSLYDGERFRAVAINTRSQELADRMRQGFLLSDFPHLKPLLDGARLVHVPDLAEMGHTYGARTALFVPLRKDDTLLGLISTVRREIRPFSDKEIALVENFAAQAVIAMENARLLTETREALEQQTATAEVLQIINSSPGDLAPVFDTMLDKALRLCGAVQGALWLIDGERGRLAAAQGLAADFVELLRERGGLTQPLQRVMRGERVIHYLDTKETELPFVAAAVAADVRTLLWVALVREGTPLGAFAIARREVRAFSDKEIALLQNFAAQAVIAMENARLLTETREALDQQTATAEVLQVINSSPGDLAPVFDAILEKAHTLCDTAHGSLQLWDGEKFRGVATRGFSEAMIKAVRRGYSPGPNFPSRRIVDGERVVHCVDVAEIDDPIAREGVELSGSRTMLHAALRKDDVLLGQIVSARQEVRPFSEKQIALVENFAAQAVIAMENARLINETREALEQQTATAEVLQVINSSPGHLAPVFDAMLEKMVRLCQAAHGHFLAYDGGLFHPVAIRGDARFAEFWRQGHPFQPGEGNPFAQLVRGERFVHDADAREDDAYRDVPVYRRIIDLGGIRTSLTVPLRKEGVLLGAVRLYRQEVRPFSEKQIALVENFAQQAVIAMENARLLTETREALDQQTATAEVLQVINSSPGELAPVFDAMLEKAMRLCEAAFGSFLTFDGEHFSAVVHRGVPPELVESFRRPQSPTPGGSFDRLVHGERIVHLADISDDDAYRRGLRGRVAMVDIGGARTAVWVALRRDDALLGALVLYRQEVRRFTDKQVALVANFAAQAVIAMENARLITETREALEQQTATAEVLQVINASPGDLAPVFDAILEKAHTLCGVALGSLVLNDGERLRAVATHGYPAKHEALAREGQPSSGPFFERLSRGEVVQLPDMASLPAPTAMVRSAVEIAGSRTYLAIPLRKDGALLGFFSAHRQEVRPFSDKQIALLQNFAAQAVIAMENARLLTETREALEQQTATAEVLQVINSSPGELAPVFDAILEKAHSLCGAETGVLFTYDGERFQPAAAHDAPVEFSKLMRDGFLPSPGNPLARLIEGEPLVHIDDISRLQPECLHLVSRFVRPEQE